MADSTSDELRAELARLGIRRERLEEAQTQLSDDVRDALKRAYGRVSVAEAARLLHIHRTTVYRVYEPHGRTA